LRKAWSACSRTSARARPFTSSVPCRRLRNSLQLSPDYRTGLQSHASCAQRTNGLAPGGTILLGARPEVLTPLGSADAPLLNGHGLVRSSGAARARQMASRRAGLMPRPEASNSARASRSSPSPRWPPNLTAIIGGILVFHEPDRLRCPRHHRPLPRFLPRHRRRPTHASPDARRPRHHLTAELRARCAPHPRQTDCLTLRDRHGFHGRRYPRSGAFAAKPRWGADPASAARALPAGRPTATSPRVFATGIGSARVLDWRALVSRSCSREHRSDM
jgi:hypothetical protein